VRADDYSSSGGHVLQESLITGLVTLDKTFPSKSTVVPTARAGVRYDVNDDVYLRTAAYEGFRPPSLNELYRPFRQGNNVTVANPGLIPEKLYGLEGGIGGDSTGDVDGAGGFEWALTLFYNQIHSAIGNVTVHSGPGFFPDFPEAGFIPPGGLLIQRQNVGNIVARGLEGEATYHFGPTFDIRFAGDWVDATVNGGTSAPLVTGKRPTQAPEVTLTGGIDAILLSNVTVNANFRYESVRWADDQNTLRLPPATTVNARIAWAFASNWSVFVQGDNILDANIATTMAADGTVSYGTPRIIQAGFSFIE